MIAGHPRGSARTGVGVYYYWVCWDYILAGGRIIAL